MEFLCPPKVCTAYNCKWKTSSHDTNPCMCTIHISKVCMTVALPASFLVQNELNPATTVCGHTECIREIHHKNRQMYSYTETSYPIWSPINIPVSLWTSRQAQRTGSALNLRIIVGSIRFDVRLLTDDRNLLATLWLRCRLDQAEQCGGDEAKCKLQNDKRQKTEINSINTQIGNCFCTSSITFDSTSC